MLKINRCTILELLYMADERWVGFDLEGFDLKRDLPILDCDVQLLRKSCGNVRFAIKDDVAITSLKLSIDITNTYKSWLRADKDEIYIDWNLGKVCAPLATGEVAELPVTKRNLPEYNRPFEAKLRGWTSGGYFIRRKMTRKSPSTGKIKYYTQYIEYDSNDIERQQWDSLHISDTKWQYID